MNEIHGQCGMLKAYPRNRSSVSVFPRPQAAGEVSPQIDAWKMRSSPDNCGALFRLAASQPCTPVYRQPLGRAMSG